MPSTSNKTAIISTLLLVIFLESPLSCNSKRDTEKSKSLDNSTEDSLQIKRLADKFQQGKETFRTKCTVCHIAPERHITDQYLFDNLFDRLPKPSEDYFIRFIKNGKVLKASGDSYAIKLAESWNSDYDHVFQDTLSSREMENLIIYIKGAIKQKHHER
jgi:hypothetical protein